MVYQGSRGLLAIEDCFSIGFLKASDVHTEFMRVRFLLSVYTSWSILPTLMGGAPWRLVIKDDSTSLLFSV
jgi:hypothetical protein